MSSESERAMANPSPELSFPRAASAVKNGSNSRSSSPSESSSASLASSTTTRPSSRSNADASNDPFA